MVLKSCFVVPRKCKGMKQKVLKLRGKVPMLREKSAYAAGAKCLSGNMTKKEFGIIFVRKHLTAIKI
jgi:hypothetical protein